MLKSVAFYPEYLPRAQWRENMRKVKEGNIRFIRFGEFAWGHLQPDEGRFHWQLFDEAFDMAEEEGLQVILGTPTPCPPIWLCERYPDVLPVNERGETIGFGGRQHRCYNSPSYQKYTEIIVDALAKRYGRRKSLFAWQIDNELGAEHKYCYCPVCRAKFQKSLAEKYGTIEALNERWMNNFWAQNYQRFDQIAPPGEINAYLPLKQHPSLMYEFLKFSSQSIVAYAHAQYDIIRRHSDAVITTNQDDFSMGDNTDWFQMFGKLDVAAFDIYTQNLYELGFYFDLARSIHQKPCWLLEYGAQFPCLNDVLDLASEKECGLAGLFAFNPFPAGQEQGMFGLVDMLGRPRPNYSVFRDWEPPLHLPPHPRRLLFRYDFESSWSYSAAEYHTWESGFPQKQSRLIYQRYYIHTVYKAAFNAGFGVDFPASLQEYGKGDILILPMQIIWKESLEQELLSFIHSGGHLITTNDLFLKNEDNAYVTVMPGFYTEIMGEDAAFVTEEGKAILRTLDYGEGKVWFIDQNAGEACWVKLFRSL